MNKITNLRFGLIAGMILLAALSRLLPHPPNFTAVGAMALFGGAYLSDRRIALLVPLLAMWVSDLILNNVVYGAYFDGFSWYGSFYVYGSFLLIALLGTTFLKKVTTGRVVGLSLSASMLFFLITNFGDWLGNPIYAQNLQGLSMSYAAGLPFLRNALLGDLFFCGLLFGTFEWLKNQYPTLQLVRQHAE